MKKTTLARAGVALGAAALLALAAPLAASAHVHVDPGLAAAGSYATLTFRVPNESATAGTVTVEVDLPTDTPFTSVSYQPVSGWTAQVVTEKLAKPVAIAGATVTEAPTQVIWTAEPGTQIGVNQFQRFVISAGPVPATGHILLPTHQTYSDGVVVVWNQKTPAGGKEPEHPAPTLYINDAPPSAATGSASGAASVTASPKPDATASATSATSPSSASSGEAVLAIGLGIAGLALGAIALVVAVFAATRRRAGGHASKGR